MFIRDGEPIDFIGIGSAALTGISNNTNKNQIGTAAAPKNPLLSPLQNNGGVLAGASGHTLTIPTEAPLSRALANSLTRLGSLMGKVPRDVREHLRYGPFRNFCRFNVDAEDTAELCWQRLIDLTPMRRFSPAFIAAFSSLENFLRIASASTLHRI